MNTKLDRIAQKAKTDRKLRFTCLAHLLTPEFLLETWKMMNRKGASGVDGGLHAGVMEDGELSYPESGSTQGGVISPLLANVYLHEVVDTWFHCDIVPRLRGRARLVRYADDLVMTFS